MFETCQVLNEMQISAKIQSTFLFILMLTLFVEKLRQDTIKSI